MQGWELKNKWGPAPLPALHFRVGETVAINATSSMFPVILFFCAGVSIFRGNPGKKVEMCYIARAIMTLGDKGTR